MYRAIYYKNQHFQSVMLIAQGLSLFRVELYDTI